MTVKLAKSPDQEPEPAQAPDFEAIYAEHFAFVWRCLRALGVSPGALDDAAQEVFLVVHRRFSEFRGESSVRTWLYAIVRNVASNQRRTQRRRDDHAELSPDQKSSAPSPHERAQDRQAATFVTQFLADAPDHKRDVFVLVMIEQMPVPEVAETLGVPLNTVYTRLRNARLDFQRALRRRGGT